MRASEFIAPRWMGRFPLGETFHDDAKSAAGRILVQLADVANGSAVLGLNVSSAGGGASIQG